MRKYTITILPLLLILFTSCSEKEKEQELTLDTSITECTTALYHLKNPITQMCETFTSSCNLPSNWKEWASCVITEEPTTSLTQRNQKIKNYELNKFKITLYNRASDIVMNESTGLMWQDNLDSKGIQKKWLIDEHYKTCEKNILSTCSITLGDTASTYCKQLNFGGYIDWRLPTLDELAHILDYSKKDFHNSHFQNWEGNYWSSDTYKQSTKYAWFVNINTQDYITYEKKNTKKYVKCVRESNY